MIWGVLRLNNSPSRKLSLKIMASPSSLLSPPYHCPTKKMVLAWTFFHIFFPFSKGCWTWNTVPFPNQTRATSEQTKSIQKPSTSELPCSRANSVSSPCHTHLDAERLKVWTSLDQCLETKRLDVSKIQDIKPWWDHSEIHRCTWKGSQSKQHKCLDSNHFSPTIWGYFLYNILYTFTLRCSSWKASTWYLYNSGMFHEFNVCFSLTKITE